MNHLQSETSDNSRINEAKPLLHDKGSVTAAELYALGGAVGGSTEGLDGASGCAFEADYEAKADIDNTVKTICGSKAAISDAMGDSTEGIDGASTCADESVYEAQADMDKIVKALFLAWLQFPPRRLREPEGEESQFLSPRALNAMSTVWLQIKAERDVLPEPEKIVQGLTKTMLDYIYRHVKVPEEAEDVIKEIITTHVTKKVSDGWQQVLDGIEKEAQERERRKRIRERLRRSRERAEVLRFYEPFAHTDDTLPLNCRNFCLVLCQLCSIFIFQVPIHTLLLSWPISIGIMGGLYMTQCPMSHLMPYVMMALGAVGTVALLMRLSFVIYQKFSKNKIRSMRQWILLKVIEFMFLDFLIIQLFYFFSETPSFDPGSPKYCNETFYSFVYRINYVSIALVAAWIFVYFTKGLLWLQSSKFCFWLPVISV